MEPSLTDNLSLFELNKQLLAEFKIQNNLLLQSIQLQEDNRSELQKLVYLLNAFTSGGTPHRSYVPDHLLTAYLALVGPALGARISNEEHEPSEVIKASIIIARDLLEEINAYNTSSEPGKEAIKNALQFSKDPWQESQEVQAE